MKDFKLRITRYADMTQEQLSKVDDDDIVRLIEIECAFEGIRPIDEPEKPVYQDVDAKKTEIAYVVGDGTSYGTAFMLKNKEDAEAILKMQIVKSDYDYDIGNSFKWLKATAPIGFIEKHYYKQKDVKSLAVELKENELRRKKYESQLSAYNSYTKAVGKIQTQVHEAVTDAKESFGKFDKARERLQKLCRSRLWGHYFGD